MLGCGLAIPACTQAWPELIIPAPQELGPGARFGTAISLDGDLLLVGAPGASIGGPATGAAYLFGRNEGGENAWDLIATMHLPAPLGGAAMGAQVLMAGDLAIVAVPRDVRTGVRTGSVLVFEKDVGGPDNWGLLQRIVPDSIQEGLGFGTQLQMVQGTLIVACPGYDEQPGDALLGMGALAMFRQNETGLFAPLPARFLRGDALVDTVAARPCAGDRFNAVGDLLVHVEQSNSGGGVPPWAYGPGRAYFLDLDSLLDPSSAVPAAHRLVPSETFGDPLESLIITEGAAAGDRYTLGVLHPALPGVHAEYHRAVTFATNGAGALVQLGSALPDTAFPYLQYWPFGREGWEVLGVADGRLLVGASGDSTFTPLGHAEVFASPDGGSSGWSRIAYLQPSDPQAGDLFGVTGALGEGVVILGAPLHADLDRGRVYVYTDPAAACCGTAPDAAPAVVLAPNPVPLGHPGPQVRITASDPSGILQVLDMKGRMVWQGDAAARSSIPASLAEPGAYLLSWRPVQVGASRVTVPFIITP